MINKLRVRAQGESGFTLVELLVVMLILGLLAAIAIPAFFNQRIKAQDAEAKSTAKTAQTALETYATDNGGKYGLADRTKLNAIEPTLTTAITGSNSITTLTVTDTSYTITINSASNNTFTISRATTGVLTYPCTVATGGNAGGCPGASGWG
jgi:type IV pilus assembly protein PilA